MVQVLNKRLHGIPKGAIYIGRPSRWGNPFRLEDFETRDACIAAYRSWLFASPELIRDAKRELKGKDLVCWCAPASCHGDVLAEIANSEE